MGSPVWEVFRQTAGRRAHKTALIYQGGSFSYEELVALAERLAGALHEIGIDRGDRVAIYQPHAPQWILAWFALQRIGAVAVPITHFYGPRDLGFILRDSGSRAVFCMDTNYQNLAQVVAEGGLKPAVIISSAFELLPRWKALLGARSACEPAAADLAGRDGILSFEDLLRREAPPPPLPEGGEDDLVEILYTSGTTGLPKGVPLTHRVFLQSAEYQRGASEALIPRGKDVVLQGSPLYHILGQNIGLGALLAGDALILLPQMDIGAVVEHVDRYGVTTIFGTPTFFRMILEYPGVERYDLSSLVWCYTGGDYLPKDLAERWSARFGKPIYQGYGATEAAGGIAIIAATDTAPEGATGRMLPPWKGKLVDPDTFEPLLPPGPGELLISADHMVTAYWNNPTETAEKFVYLDGRIWFRTGDIVRLEEDGWLFFVDRTTDMIKYKGYRVAPSKIERVLREHPAVNNACAIGVPDAEVGERIKVFVILNKGMERPDRAEELIQWCRERLAPYEVPQLVEFREELPQSRTGKILRRELREADRAKALAGKVPS